MCKKSHYFWKINTNFARDKRLERYIQIRNILNNGFNLNNLIKFEGLVNSERNSKYLVPTYLFW